MHIFKKMQKQYSFVNSFKLKCSWIILLHRYFNLYKLRVNTCRIFLAVGRFLTCHFGLNLFVVGTSCMAVFRGHFVYMRELLMCF